MKRRIFVPDYFPVCVRQMTDEGERELMLDYDSGKGLFTLENAGGSFTTYSFKALARLLCQDRSHYVKLGRDGFSRPVTVMKEDVLNYASDVPGEKLLAYSQKADEVYSIQDGSYFLNGEPVDSLAEGSYILHPCTKFKEFRCEVADKKSSFPWLTAAVSFLVGVAGGGALLLGMARR